MLVVVGHLGRDWVECLHRLLHHLVLSWAEIITQAKYNILSYHKKKISQIKLEHDILVEGKSNFYLFKAGGSKNEMSNIYKQTSYVSKAQSVLFLSAGLAPIL